MALCVINSKSALCNADSPKDPVLPMKFFTQPEKVIFFTKDNGIFIINSSDEYCIVLRADLTTTKKKAYKFIEKWKLVILL